MKCKNYADMQITFAFRHVEGGTTMEEVRVRAGNVVALPAWIGGSRRRITAPRVLCTPPRGLGKP